MSLKSYFGTMSSRFLKIFLILVVTFLSASLFLCASSVVYAEYEGPSYVGLEKTNTLVVLTGDFNGDGALDYVSGQDIVFFGEPEPPSVLYLNKNDGTGQFVKGSTFTGLAEAVGDMNGDGTLDIITNDAGVIKIYLNDGHGNIVNTITLTNSHDTGLIAVGDMNSDGNLDIVSGNFRVPSRIYFNNDNNGTFTTGPDLFDSTLTISISVGDVNGDKALDIVAGKAFTQTVPVTADVVYPHTVVYLNDKAGGFTKTSTLSQVIPKDNIPTNVSPFVAFVAHVKMGRVDTDGALDIIADISYWGIEIYTNANNMQGEFLAESVIPATDGAFSIDIGDMNNDGFLDIIALLDSREIIIYLNDNTGKFIQGDVLSKSFPSFFLTGVNNLALGDVDNNSTLDIILGTTQQPDVVYLNNGVGGFSKPVTFNHIPCKPGNPITCSVYKPSTIAVGDVDNNGTLDLIQSTILGSDIWGQVAVILNSSGSNCNGVQYLETPVAPRAPDPDDITQVVLGDINNDNALDIIQASYDNDTGEGYLVIYLNSKDGCGTFAKGMFIDNNNQNLAVTSIAVGDLNDDGTLDMISGSKGKLSVVYLNQKNSPGNFIRGPEIAGLNNVRSLAVGDVNGDDALDVVAGNFDQPSVVYLNRHDGSAQFERKFELAGSSIVRSVALGHLNGDDALDIVAVSELPIIVYTNNGTGLFDRFETLPNSEEQESVVLGDIDGDSTIDIVTNDSSNTFLVFLNDGNAKFRGGTVLLPSNRLQFARGLALGDINYDGALDIALARAGEPNTVIYLNMYRLFNLFNSSTVVSNSAILARNSLLSTNFAAVNNSALASNSAYVAVKRPLLTGNANYFSSSEFVEGVSIPITYTLFDNESNSVGRINVQYSPDGGGLWYPATASATTLVSNLSASPYPAGSTHVFNWDTFADGFFGQSDNVVLRFRVYPQDNTPASAGAYRYIDTVSGPYQWPFALATTFPFSVRGTQIQVYKETTVNGNEVANAQIYRLKKGQKSNATLLGDESGPFTTDQVGNLRGHGRVEPGDQLIALLPITATEAYTLYHTNITPTLDSLEAFTVTAPGVQTIAVSAAKPLLLFNSKVSLEWDARKDTNYLEQLKFDLQRTSELLFDLSNGQAALGDVTLYYNKEQWDEADLRIYATNDLRPHATIGGVLRKPRLERFPNGTVHLFGRGHVEIGAVWNRYGNAGERLSEDWARTLAHELGHYLFFLHDNYIGLQNDRLIRVDGCPGVMGDPYLDSDSEFHPDQNWLLSPCEQTFSHQVLGQSDWATIRHFYPWLNIPTVPIADPSITGPNLLPLAVTRIITTTPVGQAETIEVPSFDLTKESGGRYVANSSARAFLLQGNRLVSLGAPRQDRVQAWNARPGDQLCVYDLAAQPPLTGCEKISKGDQGLTLHPRTGWQPEVIVTPITTQTISITVNISNSLVSALSARIYPQTPLTDALPAVPLQPVANGFAGIITLTQPAFVADVHIFDSEQDPKLAALAEYTLGGAPTLQLAISDTLQLSNGDIVKLFGDHTLQLSNGGTLQLSNGDTLQLSNGGTLIMKPDGLTLQLSNGGVLVHPGSPPQSFGGGTLILSNGDTLQLSNGGTLQLSNGNTLVVEEGETLMLSNGDAPIRSNDGQITLFGEPTNTPPGQFYTLQSTTKLPGSPTYATLVGRAYRLSASSVMNTSNNLAGASISFNYLGRDIDADKEHLLKIYFWDGAAWYRLDDTIIDEYHNIASAVVPDRHNGLGIYALLYSTEIPLNGPGWNSFAFVGPNGQSVPDALASINGLYKIVWGYEPKPGPSDLRHWQAYDPSIPPTNKFYDWVNNLKSLTYGRGYWLNISATGNITLYLKSSTGTVIASAATPETVGTTTSPPAVYYGEVWPTEDFTPLPGMTVTAWVDGQLCGQTQTRDLQGTVAYVLYIPAVGDSEYPNCGAVGRMVTFKVNDVPMLLNVGWDNTTIRLAPLFNRWVNPFFLPIIVK